MQLRLLLTGCVVLALAVVGQRLVWLAGDARESASLDRQRAAVELMARNAAGLLVLAQDYLLHGNPRALRQWEVMQSELGDALKDYAAAGSAQNDDVDDLIQVAANLPPLFESLRSLQSAQSGPAVLARRETLADQLINETRRISDGAFEVSHRVTERRRAANHAQRNQSLATQGATLALVLLLAWMLSRRVLRPLAQLQQGAQRVQDGDLGARTGYRSGDEMGRLSQAFDAMTASLQERAGALQASNERLARSEAFQERAGRIAGVGGWELDLANRKPIWSEQTRAIHDVAADFEPTLASAVTFYAPEARPVLQEALRRAIADGTSWDLELPFTSARGRALWVRVIGTAEFVDGPAVRLVGALQDVTARRAADEALRQATQQAHAASEAKTAFLANMSHEIRTPLNAVIGLSHLMQQTRLDGAQQALLSKINTAGRALLEVINDVLDLSKIEAGELELACVTFDPRVLVDELIGVFAPQAAQRGIALYTAMPGALPPRLRGDAARLRQVLTNLLSNALKFTLQGMVRLAVDVEVDVKAESESGSGSGSGSGSSSEANAATGVAAPDDGPPLRLRFAVEDTGIGISAHVRERLFTPFTQADATTTRRFGGTGLGLSIVKRLVTLQGGGISVSSVPGAGSRFEVTLPFHRADAEADDDDILGLPPVEVLVAAHDPAQREALVALCGQFGWRTESVGDAQALFERVRARLRDGPAPDALVVDDALPGLADVPPLAALQAEGGTGQVPAVVVIRPSGREAMARAPPAALAGVMLDEPVDASALFNAVRAAVAQCGGDAGRVLLASAFDTADVARLPGVCVLLVDDSDINLEVAQRILVAEGAEVRLARDGGEAVSVLRSQPAAVDIVLMDVQMPVLDGLAAARAIRGDLGLTRLPLVALTAGALLSERQRALDAGMDSFVSKPFEPRAMVGLMRRLVERARGAPLPLAPRPGVACDATVETAGWPTIEGIDGAQVRRRLVGDLRLFTLLLDRLCDEFGDLVQPAPSRDDPAALSALSARLHKLAGSAGLLGAEGLRQAAAGAESALRRGAGSEEVTQRVAAVACAYEALLQSSAPWRTEARQQRAEQAQAALPVAGLPVDDADFVQWKTQLQVNDLNALVKFEQIAPALRVSLGGERYEQVESALGRLAFDRVLQLVREDDLASAPVDDSALRVRAG